MTTNDTQQHIIDIDRIAVLFRAAGIDTVGGHSGDSLSARTWAHRCITFRQPPEVVIRRILAARAKGGGR